MENPFRSAPRALLLLLPALLAGCNMGSNSGSASPLGTMQAGADVQITSQPAAMAVSSGQTASFSVGAVDTKGRTLMYQWLRNGAVISGATADSYTFTAQANDAGSSFSVVVTDQSGCLQSLYQGHMDIDQKRCVLSGSAVLTAGGGGYIQDLAGALGGFGNLDGSGAATRLGDPNGVTVDDAGNIYVTDGLNNAVRKISPAGQISTLAGANIIGLFGLGGGSGSVDGSGLAARFSGPTGIVSDAAGNLYVCDTENSTIRKISPSGTVSTLAGSAGAIGNTDGTGTAARFNFGAGFVAPNDITIDPNGNLYVADTANGLIRLVTPGGTVTTLPIHGIQDPQGIARDSAGNLYISSAPNGIVYKVAPDYSMSVFANLSAGAFIIGLVVDAGGTVYVSNGSDNTVSRISPDGTVTLIAGSGIGSADGLGSAASFHVPLGIALDNAGNLLVADGYNSTLRRITPAGQVSTIGGKAPAFGSADGLGTGASFHMQDFFGSAPGLPLPAIDNSGNIYLADIANHTIRKISPAGLVSTIAGSAGNSGSADGMGSAARFHYPSGVTLDAAGNLYVTDSGNDTIRKITAAGLVTTVAGSAGNIGSSDGTGSDARFSNPTGIAVDAGGTLYVTDSGNGTIRTISPAGVVSTLAGTAGYNGSSDGTGPAASFSGPSALALDAAGNIYVTDYINSTVRKITPAGVVTTLAGLAHNCGAVNGTGASARLCLPYGIAVNPATGNILVADTFNATIRQITPAGVVTTLVGTFGSEGVLPGPLPAASPSALGSLDLIGGMAVDSHGALYTISENALIKIVLP